MYFNFSNLLEENRIVTYQISKHNIIYSSQKPRKLLSLPLKLSSWLFSLSHDKDRYNRCTGIYKFGNNTYPERVRRRSNLGHIFLEKKCVLWAGKYGKLCIGKAFTVQILLYHFLPSFGLQFFTTRKSTFPQF